MNGMTVLDIVIGMVFLYLLLSLACTALNELVAQWWNTRASTLSRGIATLLGGPSVDVPLTIEAAEEQLHAATGAVDDERAVLKGTATHEFNAFETAHTALAAAEHFANEATAAETAKLRQRDGASRNFEMLGARGADAAALAAAKQACTDAGIAAVSAGDTARKARTAAISTRHAASSAQAALRRAASDRFALYREKEHAMEQAKGAVLMARLYSHPLIRGLAQPHLTAIRFRSVWLPSYIPSGTLATALHDVIAPAGGGLSLDELKASAGTLPEQIRRPLLVFMREAEGDIDVLRKSLERWYEDAMQRVSGLYKRKTQLVVLLLSAIIVVSLNVDSIRVAKELGNNAALRASIVAQAEAFAHTPPAELRSMLDGGTVAPVTPPVPAASPTQPGATKGAVTTTAAATRTVAGMAGKMDSTTIGKLDSASAARQAAAAAGDSERRATAKINAARFALTRQLIDSVGGVGLPIGWRTPDSLRGKSAAIALDRVRTTFYSLPGLLLTIIAVSLGAPFWFDILNKVINIRGAGRAPEEKPKSPEALPPPRGA